MGKKYNMPNPCTEKWDDMTPTEQGAICDVCATEIFDFTNKSPEEVKAFLASRSGQRTCAKTSIVQLDLMNTNYHVWSNQSANTFRSKFLYACLIVFGIGLFTGCGSAEDDEDEIVVGDVEEVGIVAEDTSWYDTTDYENPIIGDVEGPEEPDKVGIVTYEDDGE